MCLCTCTLYLEVPTVSMTFHFKEDRGLQPLAWLSRIAKPALSTLCSWVMTMTIHVCERSTSPMHWARARARQANIILGDHESAIWGFTPYMGEVTRLLRPTGLSATQMPIRLSIQALPAHPRHSEYFSLPPHSLKASLQR